MTARIPTDLQLIETAARIANLPLTPARAKELVPVMDGIYGLLDALDQANLGETAPAFAFKAKWGL